MMCFILGVMGTELTWHDVLYTRCNGDRTHSMMCFILGVMGTELTWHDVLYTRCNGDRTHVA